MRIRAVTLIAFAVALVLAGCPQAGDEPAPAVPNAPDLLTEREAPAADADADDQEDRRRRAIAWLLSDSDNDGLSNEIELEFGLDPNDPTDGPDIDGDGILNCCDDDVDGDGVLNQTDPDIDGDGLFNLIDVDIDGDAVPNPVDFDIDADGIRNKWDWDSDSDDEDDDEPADGDEDDDDDDDEKKDEEGDGKKDGGDGVKTDDDDEALRDAYARMAEWVEDIFGDEDSDDDDDKPEADAEAIAVSTQQGSSELTRFAAAVMQLAQDAEEGDASAKKQLRRMLLAIDVGLLRPLDPDSEEAKRITQDLARRFGMDDVSTKDMCDYVARLEKLSRPTENDASEAYDALFQQATDIQDPKSSDAGEELDTRIDSIERLAEELADVGLPETSKAVHDLAIMLGDATLDEKVDGVVELADAIDDPDLGNLTGALDQLTRTLEQLQADWDWDAAIEALKNVPGIEDGIDSEEVEEAVEAVMEGS